ncbi:MAG: C10 family peptidase [Bacteroidales bacterium]|nr:C10 family peptidase [Bacteroidales bacterium]
MKKSLLLAISAVLFVLGCSLKHSADYLESNGVNHVLTKATDIGEDTSDYSLSETDLQNYVHFKLLGNKNLSLMGIEALNFNDTPCLYAIQYNDGFDIISADKRSPIPIASCEIGIFNECNDPEGFGGHLETMAEQVWFLLHGYMREPSPEAVEYIESSLNFWKLVNADSSYITEKTRKDESDTNTPQTRFDPPGPDPGHWELIDITTEEIVYDSIPHLTSTTWYQRSVYNYFCPDDISDDGDTSKCPAGCTAIATGQMLYFLHNKIGVPLISPTFGICTGHVYDSTAFQDFWGYSSTPWSNMQPRSSTDTSAALLIGDVGKRAQMEYHWNGSCASMSRLKDYVFPSFHISCLLLNSYSSTIITSSLSSGYPLVCSGSRLAKGTNKVGHAFLIDGYKRFRTKTTYYYEWSTEDPTIIRQHPFVPRKTEVEYSSPHISFYCMNWGQPDTSQNYVWCSLDGVWQYKNLPPYIYERQMIYNFISAL